MPVVMKVKFPDYICIFQHNYGHKRYVKASIIMFVHTDTHTCAHIYTPINAHLHIYIYTNKQTNKHIHTHTNFPDNSSFVKHDACMCVTVIDGLFRSNRAAMGNLPYYR